MPTTNSASKCIARELNLPEPQVRAAMQLFADGNTIPFIARYRKEATGNLDEVALRAIEDAFEKRNTLEARKSTILKSLSEQDVLTDNLRHQVENCEDLRVLEEIYLPFKPKRRTRATIARDQGLGPLAELLLKQQRIGRSRSEVVKPFVSPDDGVPDENSAIAGALDIVAETWSEVPEIRRWLFDQAMKFGKLNSRVKRGKKSAEGAEKFESYFDRSESVARIPGHRVLAMLRGVSEGILRIDLNFDGTRELAEFKRRVVSNRDFEFFRDLTQCAEDCYQRLLLPAIESAVVASLKERAEDEAIAVFGDNLQKLLLAAPAGPRVTIGIDPGFRTGCKVAVVDATGQFLAHTTIYPTAPKNDTAQAETALLDLIKKHAVEMIAIGNGTASRETDIFVANMLKAHSLDLTKVMVSEAGASIYSASEVAAQEFPDLDLTVRGAISIARRLQDPLAELVKSDPKSIGVGQYQHDVNQSKLRRCLDRVVESCVNRVGVDVNLASAPLLAHVAGIGPGLARNIVEYRNSKGPFSHRQQLLKVSKLGKKAFEQSAGFLRIRDSKQPLDNSAVHPESYSVAERMAKSLKAELRSVIGNAGLVQRLKPSDFVDDRFGLPTVEDIIQELGRPGRDPRNEFREVKFQDSITGLDDLKPNLILEGRVTNVTHFGAFVDLGVHQDGLIHISQLADEFVSNPGDVISVGDLVRVKVLEVDVERKRISLTRKQVSR